MNFSANAVQTLAHPILIITLGVNPLWIGTAMGVMRLLDAFIDTLIGHWSDHLRTRFGRRRPIMALGGLTMGLAFGLIWWFPRGWSHEAVFTWFCLANGVFLFCMSLFVVPMLALGSELTHAYNERTSLNAYAGFGQKLSGFAIAWLFPFVVLSFFADSIQGVRALAILAGAVIIALAVVPVLVLREDTSAATTVPKRESFVAAMRVVMGSRLFWRFAGIMLFQGSALMAVYNLGTYINIYYVFGGDIAAASKMVGVAITLFNVLGIATIPLVTFVARRIGKHRCLALCLAMMSIAAVLKFLLYRPDMPYLQLGVFLFQAPGQAAYYVVLTSMLADYIDYDECESGQRRAALIMAASGWLAKVGISAAFVVSGLVLNLAHFDASKGANQADGVILKLRLAYAFVPLVGSLAALWLVRGYPLTKQRMAEVQVRLNGRKEANDSVQA